MTLTVTDKPVYINMLRVRVRRGVIKVIIDRITGACVTLVPQIQIPKNRDSVESLTPFLQHLSHTCLAHTHKRDIL